MEKSYDPGWGGSPIDMGVAPANPDGSFTSNGLDVTTCYGIHFDPFDKSHFFISYTDIGLFHTFSGGRSWIHSISDIPGSWQNTCYDVEFDPSAKGRGWSVWANAHDLPRDKMFGDRGFGNFEGGVAVSDDAGLTWEKSNAGIPENSICTNIRRSSTSVAGRALWTGMILTEG